MCVPVMVFERRLDVYTYKKQVPIDHIEHKVFHLARLSVNPAKCRKPGRITVHLYDVPRLLSVP